jgi:hypothetical protein
LGLTYYTDRNDPNSANAIDNEGVDEVQEACPAVIEAVDHQRLPACDAECAQLDDLALLVLPQIATSNLTNHKIIYDKNASSLSNNLQEEASPHSSTVFLALQ